MSMVELMEKAKEFQSKSCSEQAPSIQEQENLKGFICEECGEEYSYLDLEDWCCSFEVDSPSIICSCCYELGMGEDL